MMRAFLQKLTLTQAVLLTGFSINAPVPALATAQEEVLKGACVTDPTACNEDAGSKVENLIGSVINILSWIVGIIAVIMIIIGGLRYITSGGDSANVTAAKNTILYAVIGLVIVAFAQLIVRFVIKKVA
jgi:hypothetical protein